MKIKEKIALLIALFCISAPSSAQFSHFFCPRSVSELLLVLELQGVGYYTFDGPRPFTRFRRATIVHNSVVCTYFNKNNQMGTATLHTLRTPMPDLRIPNNWETRGQIIAKGTCPSNNNDPNECPFTFE